MLGAALGALLASAPERWQRVAVPATGIASGVAVLATQDSLLFTAAAAAAYGAGRALGLGTEPRLSPAMALLAFALSGLCVAVWALT